MSSTSGIEIFLNGVGYCHGWLPANFNILLKSSAQAKSIHSFSERSNKPFQAFRSAPSYHLVCNIEGTFPWIHDFPLKGGEPVDKQACFRCLADMLERASM